MAALAIQKKSKITAATQNVATAFEAFDTTSWKAVSFQLNKTGAGKGTLKLQISNDGTNWFDVNTTVYPNATSAVAAGAASAIVYSEVMAGFTRAVFTEDNTGAVVVAAGIYLGKLH